MDQREEGKVVGVPMDQEEVELVARKREAAVVTQTAQQKPLIAPSLATAGLRQAIPTPASAAVTPTVPSGLHTALSLDTAGRQHSTVQGDRDKVFFFEAFSFDFFCFSCE